MTSPPPRSIIDGRNARQVNPADVDREDLVPVGGLDVPQRGDRAGDPGIVEQNRHLLVGYLLEQLGNGLV